MGKKLAIKAGVSHGSILGPFIYIYIYIYIYICICIYYISMCMYEIYKYINNKELHVYITLYITIK